MKHPENNQEILAPQQALAVFSPFMATLNELKKVNDSLTFDYNEKKGQAEARSHIAKIRSSRSAIDKAKKEATAGRRSEIAEINGKAKELDDSILKMIDVHLIPVKAAEEVETKRKAAILDHISSIKTTPVAAQGFDAEQLGVEIEELKRIEPSEENFAEFHLTAELAISDTLSTMEIMLAQRVKFEAEQVELEELRAAAERQKAAAREQAAETERLQAQERAAHEAKMKVERDLREKEAAAVEAERAELKQRVEEAEKVAADALAREEEVKQTAARVLQDKIEGEQRRANRENEAIALKKAESAANELDAYARQEILSRKAEILEGITNGFVTHYKMHKAGAMHVTNLIHDGKIPNLKIEF